MNRDLVIGVVGSLSIHAAVLFGFNSRPGEKQRVIEEAPTIEVIEMPPLEPETPPEVVESEATEAPPEFAPPMQADVPTTVNMQTFVQEVQPPPPPSAPKTTGVVTIPVNRNIGAGLGKIFDIRDLDQVPQATYQANPVYPYEMKRNGIPGSVILGFIVDTQGNVRDAYVIRSSHQEFEQPALQAVQKWRFKPGRKAGKAVNTRMQLPMKFELTNK